MNEQTPKKTKWEIMLLIVGMILLVAYGVISMYSLYKLLPENLSIIFMIVLCLGGFLLAFGPLMLFTDMTDEKKESSVYRDVVLMSLYCIPILIYGCYFYKLNEVDKNQYRIIDERSVKYKLDSEISVVDNADPDSKWDVYFSDWDNNRLDTDEVFEVGKYDIIPLVVNIHCSSHHIEDYDTPAANLNGTTVQRQVVFSFANDVGKRCENEGDLVVYDDNGNEIRIHLKISAERHDGVWNILTAKIADENEITVLNALGEKCPNLDKYTAYFGDGIEVGDGFYAEVDSYRKYASFLEFMDEYVLYEYYIGDRSEIVCVGVDTFGTLTKNEADEFFEKTLAYARNKYGYSDDDMFTNYEYWSHEDGDVVAFIGEAPAEDDKYSVDFHALYPSKMGDMESDEPDEEAPADEASAEEDEELAKELLIEETWGELKEANGGELPYDTLTEEQMKLVNYPKLNVNRVFWTPGGGSYHSVDWCYTLSESNDIRSGTLDEAIDAGKDDPCSKCVGE